MKNEPTVLRARKVRKAYGPIVALDDVDLEVRRGRCLAVVGESGSGKSTLLRCFNRMTSPDGGTVEVAGRPASAYEPATLRRSVGYVQQEGGLLPHWTVLRNASTVPWLLGEADPGRHGTAALESVGLDPARFADRWPRELSGGQRQRVALARALAHRPSVILLDEPFGALDAITRSELQEVFRGLVERESLTAVLVTHDLHEASRVADDIAVMRSGRFEQVAETGEILAHPDTPYVRSLLKRARLRVDA